LYEDIPAPANRTLWLKIAKALTVSQAAVTDVLKKYRGDTRVMIYNEKQNKKVLANDSLWVTLGDALITDLEDLLGSGNVKVTER
jgi:DNA polymerase-3 subunit alpha